MAGLGQFGGASQTGNPQTQETVVPSAGQQAQAAPVGDGGASQTGDPQSQASGLTVQRNTAPAEGPNEMEEASPEEQAQYDTFVKNGMRLMYPEGEDDPVSPKVLANLKASEQPIMNLASTAVAIVKGLVDSANRAGQPVPDEILFHAGREIVEQLADIAEAAGVHDYSEEELEGSWYQALDLYREQATQSGQIDGEALKREFGDVVQADEEGRLDTLLPALRGRTKAGEE